ncbi:unnamed protein product [Miscanthus lutarioriparius]|uniref:[RNA-polymerase]-subunit kinase n=1 Tax=Miscanthus lutarioriparius TaxID=422564 RepID=A0A811N2R0_9POAL|nr:unnamed protein product [Miscanthus lutarioriparius]
MAACVQAASAPAAVHDPGAGAGAARPTRKRTRIAMGSTDDYEETGRIGTGAFGSVHKARHRGTGRTVAIKRLAAADGSQVALLREASLLEASGRDNPFVVGFHGLARRPATMDLCLVMECVGASLHDLLHQRRCDGMPPLPEATPPPYETAGSLWYMAPEVLLGKPDYDALVDTWSLGCVMAELIDGSPLFMASNEADQLDVIFNVLGVPDETTWPWFSSAPFATKLIPKLNMKRRNLLREEFPKKKLSVQGFQVLSGLLTCNPDKRLTAAAALKYPWFATKMNTPELHLQKKEEVPSTLPKIKRIRVLCP